MAVKNKQRRIINKVLNQGNEAKRAINKIENLSWTTLTRQHTKMPIIEKQPLKSRPEAKYKYNS